jgi:5-methylcytosine-specific restriction enzyme A
MTRREVPEWIGRTPETAIPPRVKARVMAKSGDCCEHCGGPFTAVRPPEFDHRLSLVNGGENRESNLQALHRDCHRSKTNADVAMKAKDARVRAKHFGIAAVKQPIGGWAAKRFKKMPDGRVVERH